MDSVLVSPAMVPLLLAKLREAGGDSAAVCAELGISLADVQAGAGVSVERLRDLAELAARSSGDPFLGLHLGAAHQRGLHGALEMACSVAPTLGAACEQFVRCARLIHPNIQLSLSSDGRSARLSRTLPESYDRRRGRHVQEFIIATIVQVARAMTEHRVRLERVWLSRARPPELEPLRRFFATEAIEFEADCIGFSIPAAQLALPCTSHDPAMHSVLEGYARRLLDELPSANLEEPLAGLRAAIRAELADGGVTVKRIAERLALSPRTLQRQLASAGTTFQCVLDDVRRKLAAHYLDELGLQPSEVAERLGYSEPRAFFRAYKRWTGKTPKQQARVA